MYKIEEIQNELKRIEATENLLTNKTELTTSKIIIASVGSNTIRAFRKSKGHYKKYKPLSIYQSWAQKYLKGNGNLFANETDFEKIHNHAHRDLRNYWQTEDGGKIDFYHVNKLIDLLFKFVPKWEELTGEKKSFYFNNIHVPLDKYSLALLSKIEGDYYNKFPNPSMNLVNEENYYSIQNEIKEICSNFSPILFDYLAWDESHNDNEREFILKPIDEKEGEEFE